MTPALAQYIGENFTVVTHIETDDKVGSGFDATVWKENATGKIYVSFQGTTGAQDFLTNISLAFTGNAGQQVIDMANWWLKITTPKGQMARQIGKQVDPVSGLVSAAADVPGLGLVSATDMAQGIEVNGHSLGGYLATAFTRLFGAQAQVINTSTFNSAGFAPGSEGAFANLQNLIGQSYGLGRFPIGDEQTNYYAANGLNVTTNDLYFNQAGERAGLNQEEGIGTANHSMYKLTDMLALGATLEALTSRYRFGVDQLNALVKAGSSQPAGSIEGIFDALRKALEGPGITASDIGDASDSAPARVQYHAALVKFNEDHENLAGQLAIEASGPALQSQARYDFAALVALQDLSPIVVRGPLTEVWQSTRAEDYAAWEADWYLPTPSTYTDKWIADRAAMLGHVLQANEQDIEGPLNIPGAVGMHYEDVASGKQIDIGLPGNVVEKRQTIFGDGTANQLTGKKLADHLYGGAGMDTLVGLGGDDYLEGGADDDTLDGGAGTDTLAGGMGSDTYRFAGDWGVDTIEDSDGLGTIEVNGQTLAGGRLVSANAWESADKQWRYALTEQDDLVVTHTSQAGRIVVRGWSRMQGLQANPLGLALEQGGTAQPPTPEPGMYAIQGGQHAPDGEWQLQPDGSIPGAWQDYYRNDLAQASSSSSKVPGTYERITGAVMGSDGELHNTYAYTRAITIWGLGGNDFISGEQYDDHLDGGDGDDLIFGGAGSDTILGGAGDDVIVTNMAAVHNMSIENPALPGYVRGPDNVITNADGGLVARWWVEKAEDGSGVYVQRAYVKNPESPHTYWPEDEDDRDTVDAGDGDDYVWGGRGADYLIGGAGADHLAGLGGDDTILGGSGKDVVYGDDWAAMQFGAVVRENPDFFELEWLPVDQALKSPTLHGNDVIDAGADDDEVWGDGGDDVIFGGSGNDRLVGDSLVDRLALEYHGNDTLDGGEGDDLLVGDGGSDTLHGGTGDDELQGDYADISGEFHGNDVLDGGDGNDRLYGMGGSDTLYGGAGDDTIEADDSSSELAAQFHGDDYVDGGDGNDIVLGGGGGDVLLGGGGDDWIAGEDETEVDAVSTLIGNDRISGGAGNDTLVGGNGDDELSGDEGDDWLFGGAGNDLLDGGSGRNMLKGGAGDDVYATDREGVHIIEDAEGANVVQGLAGMALAATLEGDLVFSSESRTVVLKGGLVGGFAGRLAVGGQELSVEDYAVDHLTDPLSFVGHADGQRLLGGQAADEIIANGRGSAIRAGQGDDLITLNGAGASIVLNRGDGADRVLVATPPTPDMPAADKVTLQLGAGIAAQDVSFEYDDARNVLRIRYSPEPGDVLEIAYGGMLPASVVDHPPIGEIRLADGSLLSLDLTAQAADEDAAFGFQVPESAFASLGGGVSLAATLADGQPLPQWLHFDDATRTFSGTPANGDVGNLSVQVVATKDQEAAATYGFALVVRNTNDAPQAGPALEAQEFTEGEYWAYDLPEGTFMDVDAGDSLAYTATLADGSALPDWLQIDAATGRLSCTSGLATRMSVVITATDRQGAAAQQVLDLSVASSIGGNTVVGTSGDDVLVGTAGRDVLVGGLGDDILDGGLGNDEMIGGNRLADSDWPTSTGRDTYLFGRGDGRDLISNGRGGADSLDTLQFKAGIKPGDIRVSRGPATVWAGDRSLPAAIVFTIVDTGDSVTLPNFHGVHGLGYEGIDRVTFADDPGVVWDIAEIERLSLLGSSAVDQIQGYAKDDVLRGNAGNDLLWGYSGNDTFQFGKDDGKDTIFEMANEGNDRIVFDPGIRPSDVVLVKSFEGSDTGKLVLRVLTGNTELEDPNFFISNEGVESVEFADGTVWNREYILAHLQEGGGPAAIDHFKGTPGDDHYVVDHLQDSITEAVDEGIDSVESSVSYTLPDNVENLALTGMLSGSLTGNKLGNILIGNSADNILDWGRGGLDTLKGGAGNDTYRIEAPVNYEFYWNNLDEKQELKTNIIELGNEGIDQLLTNAFYARLPDNVENLKITPSLVHTIHSSDPEKVVAKYFGNVLDNVLDAGATSPGLFPVELDGGLGDDILIGSSGNADRASYRAASAAVHVSLAIAGPQDTGAAGRDTLTGIEGLVGSAFDDALAGDDQANRLDGGAGADRMAGGGGNDVYYVDQAGDAVVELEDGGEDTVRISGIGDYVMPDHVETLTADLENLSGATLTGNEGDNTITLRNAPGATVLRGMGGKDFLQAAYAGTELDGGSGDDWLVGGGGDDVLIGGTGDDVYEIGGYGGHDVIRAEAAPAPGENNTLRWPGATLDGLTFRRKDDDLVIRASDHQSVRIEKFFGAGGLPGELNPVQLFVLDDGTRLDAAGIAALVKDNAAPVPKEPLGAAQADDGQWFSWFIPGEAFVDDGGALAYSAALEDGSPLPSWAAFDPDSGKISGFVRANGNEDLRVRITATDEEGLSASAILELGVRAPGKVLTGTAGNDTLRGGGGDDQLYGQGGKDQLQGGAGSDRLEGGAGDDSLFGQAGADTLAGGAGNDYLSGGPGDDVYEYTKGDGQDTLDATDAKTAADTLLVHGWLASQVKLQRSGDHLFVRMGSTDQVALYNYFAADSVQDGAPADAKIDRIVFDDGAVWDQARIAAVLAGGGSGGGGTGPGNPPPSTHAYDHVLADRTSDFTLTRNGAAAVKGNARANKLNGNAGANVLNGAAGNDTLTGGKGADTYFLEAGTGQDTIVENDGTAGVVDRLQWGSDIAYDQLWLRKVGSNLEVSVIGTGDKAIVKDWYRGDSRHVEEIWAGGKMLSDSKVQALVEAMAAFSPPPMGQSTLTPQHHAALDQVLAANWQ